MDKNLTNTPNTPEEAIPYREFITTWLSANGYESIYVTGIAKSIREYLISEGYMQVCPDGRRYTILEKGEMSGLQLEERTNENDHSQFTAIHFTEALQTQIVPLLPEMKSKVDQGQDFGVYMPKKYMPDSPWKARENTMTIDENGKVHGALFGRKVTFNRKFGLHEFTEDECRNLLHGEIIEWTSGNSSVRGRLQRCYFDNGDIYYRFVAENDNYAAFCQVYGAKAMTEEETEKVTGMFFGREVSFNRITGRHRFTDQEVQELLAGHIITRTTPNGRPYVGRLMQVPNTDRFRYVPINDPIYRENYGPEDLT